MAAVGGPVESITINGRNFVCDSEDDVSITPKGFNNAVKQNGDGTTRLVKSWHVGSIEGLNITIDEQAGDLEFLQDLQNKCEFVPVQCTLVNGVVYNGTMQITNAVKLSTKESTAEVTLNGDVEKL